MAEETTSGNQGVIAAHYDGEHPGKQLADMLREDWEGPTRICTFNMDAPETAQLALKSINAADVDVDDLDGDAFMVRHYLIERTVYQDDDEDEGRVGFKIVLYNPDGVTMVTSSNQIARALDILVSTLGPGPWDPPLGLKFERVQTKRGRQTFRVELDQ